MKANYEKRWERIADHLDEKKKDAFVISDPASCRYLSCSHVPYFPLVNNIIITRKDQQIALITSLEEFRAKNECAITDQRVICGYKGIPAYAPTVNDGLEKALNKAKCKSVLSDTPIKIKGVKTAQDALVCEMREVKDSYEMQQIREAARITDRSAYILEGEIMPKAEGRTELQVGIALDVVMRSQKGVQGTAFTTIVATNKHGAYSHHDPTDLVLKDGDMVICDFGVYYNGYCSDMTRTFPVGDVSEKMARLHNTVAESQEVAFRAIKQGATYGDLDRSVREFLRPLKLDRYFVHSLGHGFGLDVHENPALRSQNKDKIKSGTVFTIEPGVYLPGKGGIRIEDDVYIGKRPEWLTHAKRRL